MKAADADIAPEEKADAPFPGIAAVRDGKIGVLLVNLGTPDGTDYWSMWRYLREFLSDPRVIELNKAIWYPILYGLVLTTRPKKAGANYAKIWNRERDESPLRTYTRAQSEKLAAILSDEPRIVVDYAMRYGNPSIASVVEKMKKAGCDRVLTFPLYPQYSATTTATANDKLFRALATMRDAPAVRSVPPYYDEPVYIEALARSVENHLATLDFDPEVVIASYHGIPKPYSDKGDPYRQHCLDTTRLLDERLGWKKGRLITCFQSRFGAQEWLQPYTDKTVERLAAEGVKSIAILNPGFSADCIETLEEIDVEAREIFLHGGGKHFSHIPCLNDSDEGMAVIEAMVRRELLGWL
ncbi:MAG TPA: ferrochelatase [Rhizobiaceae bacterium]|nr:ferrochelatase [Rhizobiaceae bacterium]